MTNIQVPQSTYAFGPFNSGGNPVWHSLSWQGKVLTKRHLQSVYQSELIRQTFTKSWQFNTRREGRELTRPGQLGKHTKRPLIGPPDLGLSTLTPLSSDIRSLSFLSETHICSILALVYMSFLPWTLVSIQLISLPSFPQTCVFFCYPSTNQATQTIAQKDWHDHLKIGHEFNQILLFKCLS